MASDTAEKLAYSYMAQVVDGLVRTRGAIAVESTLGGEARIYSPKEPKEGGDRRDRDTPGAVDRLKILAVVASGVARFDG